MKKSIKIATLGVAALGFAAAPVLGASAADNVELKDELTITVSDNCAFTRTSGTGSYSATMTPNALNESVGTSSYKVICNNSKGYSVGAVFTGLTGDQDTPSIISYSATTPTAGSGTWTAAKTTVSGNIAAENGTLMSNSGATSAAGDTETVTYKVSTTTTQAQGSYEGDATYKFVQAS